MNLKGRIEKLEFLCRPLFLPYKKMYAALVEIERRSGYPPEWSEEQFIQHCTEQYGTEEQFIEQAKQKMERRIK
jgi:hypothetical protein